MAREHPPLRKQNFSGGHVRKLMKQRVPKVVDSIMAKRKANYRMPFAIKEASAIKFGFRQMPLNYDFDSAFV